MPLADQDILHLNAALGYLEIGMVLEANEELEKIDPYCRHLPEVLCLRVDIYKRLEQWDLMEAVAGKFRHVIPQNPDFWAWWAYATRRAKTIEAAKVILLEAAELHPKNAQIQFNLACYECQLGRLKEAKQYLKQTFAIDQTYRMNALDDPDLEPLWGSLK